MRKTIMLQPSEWVDHMVYSPSTERQSRECACICQNESRVARFPHVGGSPQIGLQCCRELWELLEIWFPLLTAPTRTTCDAPKVVRREGLRKRNWISTKRREKGGRAFHWGARIGPFPFLSLLSPPSIFHFTPPPTLMLSRVKRIPSEGPIFGNCIDLFWIFIVEYICPVMTPWNNFPLLGRLVRDI